MLLRDSFLFFLFVGRDMKRRFKKEGTKVYLWLIHVDIWQKATRFYKSIIFQLKNK